MEDLPAWVLEPLQWVSQQHSNLSQPYEILAAFSAEGSNLIQRSSSRVVEPVARPAVVTSAVSAVAPASADGAEASVGAEANIAPAAARLSDSEVEVSYTVNPASLEVPFSGNQVMVSVPKGKAKFSEGFRFALPQYVIQSADTNDIEISTLNGKRLPSWLQFVPETYSFVLATRVGNVLPYKFQVVLGHKRWVITLMER